MPTLEQDIDLPGGGDPAGVRATVQLWGAGHPVAGLNPATGDTIAGSAQALSPGWSIANLVGNADLLPAGTVYRVEETWFDLPAKLVRYVSMPAAGGPYKVSEILTEMPASIESPALAAHAADTDLHGGGRLLSIVSKTDGSFVTSAFGVPITGMDMPVVVPAKSDGTIRPYVVRFFADVIVSGASPANMFAAIQPRVGGAQIAAEWRTEGHSSTDGAAQRLTAFFEVDVPNALHNPTPGSTVTYQPYAFVFPGAPTTLTVLAQQAFGIPVPATFKAVTQ